MVSQLREDAEDVRELGELAIQAAEAGGFGLRLATATIMRGWSLAALGDVDEGIEEIRRALEGARATGARMDDPYYLGLLADELVRGGRYVAALETLSEALAQVGRAARTSRAELTG